MKDVRRLAFSGMIVGGGVVAACSAFSSNAAGPSSGDAAPPEEAAIAETGAACDTACAPPPPEEILANEKIPRRLAARGGSLFWLTDDGTARTCVAEQCEQTATTLATGYPYAGYPSGMAVDDAHVYWSVSVNSAIFRCAIAGCGGKPELYAADPPGTGHWPQAIAIDGEVVFWISQAPDEIRRCSRTGCDGGGEVIGTSPTMFTRALGSAGGDLFFAGGVDDAGDPHGANGLVARIAKTGAGGVQVLVYDIVAPRDLVASGNAAYVTGWLTGAPNDGRVIRIVGSTPTELAVGQSRPGPIATDGTKVYWANQGDGTVRRCPVAGCAGVPETIAVDQKSPESIVIDDAWVYWCNAVDGTITRLAKRP